MRTAFKNIWTNLREQTKFVYFGIYEQIENPKTKIKFQVSEGGFGIYAENNPERLRT